MHRLQLFGFFQVYLHMNGAEMATANEGGNAFHKYSQTKRWYRVLKLLVSYPSVTAPPSGN